MLSSCQSIIEYTPARSIFICLIYVINHKAEMKIRKFLMLRPKLSFYLFPLSRLTLKKRPYPKYFISIFSQDFFFKFYCKLSEGIVQCKKCYISLKNFLVFVNSLNIGN